MNVSEIPNGSVSVCAFGTPMLEHEPHVRPLFACQGCREESSRLRAAFWSAVSRGEMDAEGYTPSERRAQAQRRREADRG